METFFFLERAHILRRGNEVWPSYKILLQLAVEHADDSPLTLGAEKFLADGKCKWLWLRRERRLSHVAPNPCQAVIECRDGDEGNNDAQAVNGVLELSGGGLLSWSWETMCFWGCNGEFLKKHPGSGAIKLADGRILSWSSEGTIQLWNQHNEQLNLFASEEAHAAAELSDGRIITWTLNGAFTIWSKDGVHVKTFGTYATEGAKVKELMDGRLLTSTDSRIDLWTKDGTYIFSIKSNDTKPVRSRNWFVNTRVFEESETDDVLVTPEQLGVSIPAPAPPVAWVCKYDSRDVIYDDEGLYLDENDDPGYYGEDDFDDECRDYSDDTYNDFDNYKPYYGAIQLCNGAILTWLAGKGSLGIWNLAGELVTMLEVDPDTGSDVCGALELADGRILSWTSGNSISTLYIWTKNYELLTKRTVPNSDNRFLELADGTLLHWGVSNYPFSETSGDVNIYLLSKEGEERRVLKGHEKDVCGVRQLADGRIVSWSEDNTLRIWDCNLASHKGLEGYDWGSCDAMGLSDGRILTWIDRTQQVEFRQWDAEGEYLGLWGGSEVQLVINDVWHRSLRRIAELASGKVLTSFMQNANLWSPEGKLLCNFPKPDNFLELSDGRLLLYYDRSPGHHMEDLSESLMQERMMELAASLAKGSSAEGSPVLKSPNIQLYSAEGILLRELAGNGPGMFELSDGRILLYSWAIQVLSPEMQHIGELGCHKTAIKGITELSDGVILSWSEKEMKLWTQDGKSIECEDYSLIFFKYPELKTKMFAGFDLMQGLSETAESFVSWRSTYDKAYADLFWHADSTCTVRTSTTDGRIVASQENGQLCVLRAYKDNSRYVLSSCNYSEGLQNLTPQEASEKFTKTGSYALLGNKENGLFASLIEDFPY